MDNNKNELETLKIDFNSEFIWMVVLLAIFGGKKMNRNKINQLLDYVRKTNPTMTEEKLIEELSKNQYSSIALVMVSQNKRQEK